MLLAVLGCSQLLKVKKKKKITSVLTIQFGGSQARLRVHD